ncbi:hypothetical protein LENED_003130 [Lentinula edodes]|uniref:Uncharacterized protein n=1 Tax=Lentinula edodes TaxID=5353 RepID=A0A1Q3E2P4_LENED|nr:hypothetical protein LENED_003130 [Lentinula edodes]
MGPNQRNLSDTSERRIEALEREIESLHKEVANLTYCEAESLQTAKAAGSQLYKDKLLCEAQISRLEAQNRQLIKKLSLAQSNMRQMKEVLVQTDDRDETQATEHAHGLTKREAVVQTSDDSSFDICGKIPSISGICNEEVIDHSSAPDVSIVPDVNTITSRRLRPTGFCETKQYPISNGCGY